MSIRKTLNNKLHDIRTGIGDQIEELKAEIDRRFGSLGRKSGDEILRALPEPNGMTMPLMEALEERESERSFSNEPLPDQLVSNLLFAADGINRKGGKRTTPTALNWRETDIYLLKANGIWRWVPERRALLFCALHDIREESYLLSSRCRPLNSSTSRTIRAREASSRTLLKRLRRRSAAPLSAKRRSGSSASARPTSTWAQRFSRSTSRRQPWA